MTDNSRRVSSPDSPIDSDEYSAAQKNYNLCVSAANHITSIGKPIAHPSSECAELCLYSFDLLTALLPETLRCIFKLLYLLGWYNAHDDL